VAHEIRRRRARRPHVDEAEEGRAQRLVADEQLGEPALGRGRMPPRPRGEVSRELEAQFASVLFEVGSQRRGGVASGALDSVIRHPAGLTS